MQPQILHDKITCPSCKATVTIPFFSDIRRNEIEEDWNLAEVEAQHTLGSFDIWFDNAGLWNYIKLWFQRRRR